MKYAYYPGCSLRSTAKEYDSSLRAVCGKMELELAAVRRWVCCGSSAVHVAHRDLALALSYRNFAEVEKQGLTDMMVPCATCFSRFKLVLHELEKHPEWHPKLESMVGHKIKGDIEIHHPLEIFNKEDVLDKVRKISNDALSGLKVVCYYGCLIARPPMITCFDDAEHPQSMDRILRAFGVSVLEWGRRQDCCGDSFALTRSDIVRKLSHDILEEAKQVGAQAIAVGCPMCQFNLDARQSEIEREYGTKYRLPVFYFTQLMGIALGVPSKRLMLEKHFVDPRKTLEKVMTLSF